MRIQAVIAVVTFAAAGQAQAPAGSYLRFNMENATLYDYDCPSADIGKNQSDLSHPLNILGIRVGLGIADIVSVNGTPIKGTAYQLSTLFC